nr:hypothetical protein GCM10020185_51180 [Pseudomonas brassicacearum subsp. brassicacearum]
MTTLRRLGLAFIGLLLASVLLFMYVNSGAQQAASYIESRDLIRLLKQQDAIWDNEVLKSRIALTHNYDPLVSPLHEMSRLWQRLDAIESEPGRHKPSLWEAQRDEYLKAIKEKNPAGGTVQVPQRGAAQLHGLPARRRRRHPVPIRPAG